MGRPSAYTEDLADMICDRIAEGESLRAICDDRDLPNWRTVFRWLESDASFASKYARAREFQAEVMDAKILAVAEGCTNDTALADRVKIGAFQWRASKLAPKRYGDKVQAEISGPGGGPVEITRVERVVVNPSDPNR